MTPVEHPVELPVEHPVELPVEPSVRKTSFNDLVEGSTIYHLAVENRDIDVIKLASENDLGLVDIDGETPLHYSVSNNDLEITKLLVEINPKLCNIKCGDNETPLEWAIKYNHHLGDYSALIEYLESQ
jgi:hypothetical protein